MPIANCYLTGGAADAVDPDELVAAWRIASGIASDEMTANLLGTNQGGKRYAAMAWLSVPSVWSGRERDRLSTGLATALTETLDVAPAAVHVSTSIVESGSVVERGEIVRW